jgi:hypothetical protein
MTPKEKAEELMDKMYYIGRYDDQESYNPTMAWERGRQCALIAVDEILDVLCKDVNPIANYWFEVKQEIENLND